MNYWPGTNIVKSRCNAFDWRGQPPQLDWPLTKAATAKVAASIAMVRHEALEPRQTPMAKGGLKSASIMTKCRGKVGAQIARKGKK